MKKKLSLFLLSILFLALMMISCSQKEEKAEIIATLFPQYDFARTIVGEKYNVKLLLPPGSESHTYDPSGRDMRLIYNSDLVLYTGDIMEPWVGNLLDEKNSTGKIIDTSIGIAFGGVHNHDEKKEKHNENELLSDPHIWTSPVNAIIMIDNILNALCEKYPQDKEYFFKNAEKLKQELKDIDAEIRDVVANGKRNKLYFAGRFAFYYFVREYNLSYDAAYDSCSEDTEPTLKKLNQMTSEIIEENIPIVLYEELSDPKVAKTISEATNAQIRLFHSCHNLSKDEFSRGETYVSIMKSNIEVLKEALN